MPLFDDADQAPTTAGNSAATDDDQGIKTLANTASLLSRAMFKSALEDDDFPTGAGADLKRRHDKMLAFAAWKKINSYGTGRCRAYLDRVAQNPTSGPLDRAYVALMRADLALADDPFCGSGWSDRIDEVLDELKAWAWQTGTRDDKAWAFGEIVHSLRDELYNVERKTRSLLPFLEGSAVFQQDGIKVFLELPAEFAFAPEFEPAPSAPRPGPERVSSSPTSNTAAANMSSQEVAATLKALVPEKPSYRRTLARAGKLLGLVLVGVLVFLVIMIVLLR